MSPLTLHLLPHGQGYTVMICTLKPVTYTLRSQEMQAAVKRLDKYLVICSKE